MPDPIKITKEGMPIYGQPPTDPTRISKEGMPIYGTSDKGIESPAMAEAGIYDKPDKVDYFRHYVGRWLPELATALGAGGGASVAGPAGGVLGAGMGSMAGEQLKS